VPLLADGGLFSEFPDGRHRFCLMASGGFSIKLDESVSVSRRYLLGVLNSKLLFAYLKSKSNVFRGGWITCTKQYVGPLPIRLAEKDRHDEIVALVDRMLEMNRERHLGKLGSSELERLKREVAATDSKIDDLVYKLYGITSEERTIIEGSNQ
jgi:hypothetical protein